MGEKPIICGMFTVKEFIQNCVYAVMFAVFLIVSNQRLTLMEENIVMFTEFVRNSDNYHARVLGVEFRNGRPIGSDDKITKARKILNGNKPEEEIE